MNKKKERITLKKGKNEFKLNKKRERITLKKRVRESS